MTTLDQPFSTARIYSRLDGNTAAVSPPWGSGGKSFDFRKMGAAPAHAQNWNRRVRPAPRLLAGLRDLNAYKGYVNAARMSILETMRENLRTGPAIDIPANLERRKQGKTLAKLLARLRKHPAYDASGYAGPEVVAFDLSDKDVAAIKYFTIASRIERIPGGRMAIRAYKTCPITARHYYTLGANVSYLGYQQSPLEVHPSVAATAFKAVDGVWYASEDAAKAAGVHMWNSLDNYGKIVKTGGKNPPPQEELYGSKLGFVHISSPINQYHSPEERKNLQPAAPIRAGIELEFHAGKLSNDHRLLAAAAAKIRVESDFNNIIERDGTVTGFEVITGHAEPHVLREAAVRPVFAHRPLGEMIVAASTGMHVHVSKGDVSVSRLRDSYRGLTGFRADYMDIAGRTYRRYARDEIAYDRYSCIGSTEHTYEFRLFKNPGNMPRTMANLQYAWGLIKFFEAGNTDYRSFRDFVNSGLAPEDTVELRAFWALRTGQALPEKELNALYPRRQGITGVKLALSRR